jgi:hypothetical protein
MIAPARGLAAGFAGTVALTVSQRIEMRLTGREASDLPVRVASGVLGIKPSGRQRALVGFATHWINNTSSGLNRAMLGSLGLSGARAAAGTAALYLAGGYVLFTRLDLAPPPWRLPPKQLAIDAVHAGVYGVVTSATYELLERR